MNFQEITDTYKQQGLRRQLIRTLALKGIKSKSVLDAMGKVPRHVFIGESAFDHFVSYEDKAFQIGAGQTISAPYTVAFQTELLELKAGEKVLEIGTGSGYQTAVLVLMGARVFSIERQEYLFEKTKNLLGVCQSTARLFLGDGYKGLPAFAPFDKIIVTAGAPFIPEPLVQQLKRGGRMVIPVGDESGQVMTLVYKTQTGETEVTEYNKFSFVPLLENTENIHKKPGL